MLYQDSRIYNDIVNVYLYKLLKFLKQFIYLPLHVNRRIFIIYNYYVESFLIAMIYYNKFITII